MNLKRSIYFFSMILFVFFLSSSCVVSKKKYEELETKKKNLDKKVRKLKKENKGKDKEISNLNSSINNIREEYNDIKNLLSESNAQKSSEIDKLSSEISNMDEKLVEAIKNYKKEKSQLEKEKKSQSLLAEELKTKEQKIIKLEKMINENKEKVNFLKDAISEALMAFDSSHLHVHQKNGKVYISLDEQLLFKFGSSKVGKKGKKALKKLSTVLEKNENIDITIEGHTDNVGDVNANWDLSVARATSIVKILQKNSSIEPKRFTASGRGMYHPLDTMDTKKAKAKNRRTEIILTPKLNELYKLLE